MREEHKATATKSYVHTQRQRPATASASSSSSLGPGWYHVRHTAVEKCPHAACLKPRARPASAAVKTAGASPRSELTR